MQNILVISYLKDNSVIRRHAMPHQNLTFRPVHSYFAGWTGKSLVLEHGATGETLDHYDAVHLLGWVRDGMMGHLMAKWMDADGVPFVGRTSLELNTATKLADMVRLVKAGLAYPKTFYASRGRDLPGLFRWASRHVPLAFPVVVKHSAGHSGINNFRVRDAGELSGLAPRLDGSYFLQEYVPNSFDYRVLVVGGNVIAIIKRQRRSDSTHLNNTGRGAEATMLSIDEVPAGIVPLALAATAALGRDVAGVDVVVNQTDGRPYLLEVNKAPSISCGTAEHIDIGPKLRGLYAYIDMVAGGRRPPDGAAA